MSIYWFFDAPGYSPLGLSRQAGGELTVDSFSAKGRNDGPPMKKIGGSFRSDVGGGSVPFVLIVDGEAAAPGDVESIPTGAEFVVHADLDPLPAQKFLDEFGAFSIVLRYGGKENVRGLSREEVQAIVDEAERGTSTALQAPPPGVMLTRKARLRREQRSR